MDQLGLPVFVSVRPRARILRVNAGKGMNDAAARVGAYMEAIEYAAAEPSVDTTEHLPQFDVRSLIDQFPTKHRFIDLVPRLGEIVRLDDRLSCVSCESLASRTNVWFPAQLIYLPFRRRGEKNIFGGSTNGLASGNSRDEASLHSLFEIAERDAVSMGCARRDQKLVRLDTLPRDILSIIEVWVANGFEVEVLFLESDFDLPCFQVLIIEKHSGTVRGSMGTGCHADPQIALTRALTEAAQSRLSHIHGGRDDIVHYFDGQLDRNSALDELRWRFARSPAIQFSDVTTPTFWRGGHNISLLFETAVDHVKRCGFDEIYRFEFAPMHCSLNVVKLVIPRAEHIEHNLKRMGPRLMRAVLND